MLIYNVTVTLDLGIRTDWERWMIETHIPDVMATGMFISYRFNRLLNHEHDDAEIFTVQYLVKDEMHLRYYLEDYAPALQAEHKARYEGRYTVFRTLMEVIDLNDKL
jgi:Domain of unknown function (DUF4286)